MREREKEREKERERREREKEKERERERERIPGIYTNIKCAMKINTRVHAFVVKLRSYKCYNDIKHYNERIYTHVWQLTNHKCQHNVCNCANQMCTPYTTQYSKKLSREKMFAKLIERKCFTEKIHGMQNQLYRWVWH